jgi:hypothetical protein
MDFLQTIFNWFEMYFLTYLYYCMHRDYAHTIQIMFNCHIAKQGLFLYLLYLCM